MTKEKMKITEQRLNDLSWMQMLKDCKKVERGEDGEVSDFCKFNNCKSVSYIAN